MESGCGLLTSLTTIVILACVFHGVNMTFTRGTEEELRNELLLGYNNEVRPDAVTSVFMLFHMTSISSVDIKNEIFSISGFWSMRWEDSRLDWSTSNYTGMRHLQFSPVRVWTPVIVVSNSMDNLSAISEDSIPVRVKQDGTVTWTPPGLMKVSCTMDVSYFPWDVQTCGVEITSFGYTVQEMNVRVLDDGLSFRYYSNSGEWDITNTAAERSEYEEDTYTYARVTYYITVKRKPLYYGLNYLLPVMVCSALALFVFLLPPESGEKIGFCLTVLLAFMVILTLVAEDMPTTASSTSLLQIYIALVLIIGGVSVILSIINLHLFFLPDTKPIGPGTKRIVAFFATAFCLPGYICTSDKRVQPSPTPPADYEMDEGPIRRLKNISYDSSRQQSHYHNSNYDNINRSNSTSRHDRPQLVKQLTFARQNSTLGRPPSRNDKDRKLTWQDISRISDSIMMRIYFIFLVVSSLVFVPLIVTGADS